MNEFTDWQNRVIVLLELQLNHLKEIVRLMGSSNSTIAALAAAFTQFQTDQGQFNSDLSNFFTTVAAFLASLSTGSGGTVLSSSDATTLANITAALSPLDAAADANDAALKAIVLPTTGTTGTTATPAARPTGPTPPAPGA